MGSIFLRADELESFDPWQSLLPSFQSNEKCRAFAEVWYSRQQQTKSLLEADPTNADLQAKANMLETALETIQSSSWGMEE